MSLLSDMMASRATPAHLQTMGEVVTHTPRRSAAITLQGVFDEIGNTDFNNDEMNKQQIKAGTLLVGETDVNGDSYTLDNGGTFTVGVITYEIAAVTSTPGGYVVKLTRENRKTLNSARNS